MTPRNLEQSRLLKQMVATALESAREMIAAMHVESTADRNATGWCSLAASVMVSRWVYS
jgi:hypothetical protein